MKGLKVVAIVVGLLVVVVVAVIAYVATNANRLAKGAIENYGTQYLGTRVSVGDVDLSLQESRATIRNFQVDNPEGFEGPYAVRLDEISVVLDVANLSSEMVAIQRVLIDGAAVAAVIRSKKDNNFQAIMDNLEAATGGPSAEEPSSGEGELKLVIDRFDFVNASAKASSPLLGKTVDVDMPDLHLTEIGRKGQAVTVGEATRQILKPITEAVIQGSLKSGLGADQLEEGVRDKLDDAIGSGLDKLKKLGG